MGVGGSLGVISAGTVWRAFGLESAGRALVRATDSDDEQMRTLGGMMLVQAGEKSVDLVGKASDEGQLNPILVEILSDIGGPQSKALLIEIVRSGGSMAEEADQSLETLRRIEDLEQHDEAGE